MNVVYFLRDWQVRFKRIVAHVFIPFKKNLYYKFPTSSIIDWIADLFFYVLDILVFPELHLLANRLIKWNIRPLNESEIILGKSIFRDSIDFDSVRIDDRAKIGTKKIALAYVSFNTINYRKTIDKEIFIHELMHIWQYQHFGSIYIGRAIKAQRSKEGYDYGGVANLYKVMLSGGSLLAFNFEQQADIVEDYFKITKKSDLAGPMVKNIYEYFMRELHYVKP
jgi:hypothetical protein